MEDIICTREEKYFHIQLNRPSKKNALTVDMFYEIQNILSEAASNEGVIMVVFSGAGSNFCSGTDLSNFTKNLNSENFSMEEKAKEGRDMFNKFVRSFINFPKVLVAIVNGHAVGVGVTILGLFDLVYASSEATFSTPFVTLGLAPEGCSSYTFPKIMGYGTASKMLLFGEKIDAQEAHLRGLVTDIYSNIDDVWKKIKAFVLLPSSTVIVCKNAIRQNEKEILRKVNDYECDILYDQWQSEDFFNAMLKGLNRKMSKL